MLKYNHLELFNRKSKWHISRHATRENALKDQWQIWTVVPADFEPNFKTYLKTCLKPVYYMACSFSRYNACCDGLIVEHYSPVMPTGQLGTCKAKSHIINNLLTSYVRSYRENLKPRHCRIDFAIAQSMRIGLGVRFSCKDLTLG